MMPELLESYVPECCRKGHNFEARYDEQLPSNFAELDYFAEDITDVLQQAKVRTYVKDVCTRCGKEIKR
jgi:hypothetical protein